AATFAPVVGPVFHLRITGCGAFATVVDLVHVFPARDTQDAGDDVVAIFMGVEGCALKAHVKADRTTLAALGGVFQTAYAFKPVIHVVVGINKFDTVLFGKADVFLLAQFIFAHRMDIGVVEENGVFNPRGV